MIFATVPRSKTYWPAAARAGGGEALYPHGGRSRFRAPTVRPRSAASLRPPFIDSEIAADASSARRDPGAGGAFRLRRRLCAEGGTEFLSQSGAAGRAARRRRRRLDDFRLPQQ